MSGTSRPAAQAAPLVAGLAPGVALALGGAQRLGERVGQAALFQGQVAAHVDDVAHLLDEDGALLLAGTAGGARPEGVVVDDVADQAPCSAGVPEPRARRRSKGSALTIGSCHFQSAPGYSLIRSRRSMISVLGERGWPGGVGRAGVLAAAALGAGVGVEELLPGETVDRAGAQRPFGFFDVLDLGQGAGRVEAAEEDVERRGDDVPELGVGQGGDQRQRRRAGGSSRPRGRGAPAAPVGRTEEARDGVAEPRPGGPGGLLAAQAHHLDRQAGQGDEGEEAEDEGVVAADVEALGAQDVAAEGGEGQPEQEEQGRRR